MTVEIVNHDPDPKARICELTGIIYPSIKSADLNNSEVRRLIRKLVRQRDLILQSVHVMLRFSCPIFVYWDLCIYVKNAKFNNLSHNFPDISFEIPESFKDKQKSQVVSLFKKTQSIIKNAADIPEADLIHILPLSTVITFNAYWDFLEIFGVMEKIRRSNVHPKTLQTLDDMFSLIHKEFPCFFTRQNLEIFIANKEN